MKAAQLGNNVNIEVYAVGIVLRGHDAAIYLDEKMIEGLFVAAVKHRLIDAQRVMAEVYDN
jgi:hypothetical protein